MKQNLPGNRETSFDAKRAEKIPLNQLNKQKEKSENDAQNKEISKESLEKPTNESSDTKKKLETTKKKSKSSYSIAAPCQISVNIGDRPEMANSPGVMSLNSVGTISPANIPAPTPTPTPETMKTFGIDTCSIVIDNQPVTDDHVIEDVSLLQQIDLNTTLPSETNENYSSTKKTLSSTISPSQNFLSNFPVVSKPSEQENCESISSTALAANNKINCHSSGTSCSKSKLLHDGLGISCDPGPEPPPEEAAQDIFTYTGMVQLGRGKTENFIRNLSEHVEVTDHPAIVPILKFIHRPSGIHLQQMDQPGGKCDPPDRAVRILAINCWDVRWTTAVLTYVKLLALFENAGACEVHHQLHHVPEVKAAPAVSHYAAGVVPAAHFSPRVHSPSKPKKAAHVFATPAVAAVAVPKEHLHPPISIKHGDTDPLLSNLAPA